MAEHILVREGGWCRLILDDLGMEVMVRFALTPSGRLSIAEMAIGRVPGVTADALRAIPVGKVEAWANGPGRDLVMDEVTRRRGLGISEKVELDQRERADADMRAHWGLSEEGLPLDEGSTVEDEDVTVEDQPAEEAERQPLRSRVRNLRLRVPEGQPKPDSFYREVARLYSEVAVDAARPAAVLAEANGVPATRVHGWVKEARRRGLLTARPRQVRRNQ